MAIAPTDILFFLSGGSVGAGNTDPNQSLGGPITSTQLVTATLQNLFDVVSGAEEAAGDVEYRCFYVKNNHGSLTLNNAAIWISTNTPAGDTTVDIGLATQGDNGTASIIANESTAPSPTVTFSAPGSFATGLPLGNLAVGHIFAVWVRWTITAGAVASASDNVIFSVQGDTAP